MEIFSKKLPGGQNFFGMVEGLRKNCGRYKNSQTKYTPLLILFSCKIFRQFMEKRPYPGSKFSTLILFIAKNLAPSFWPKYNSHPWVGIKVKVLEEFQISFQIKVDIKVQKQVNNQRS